jgi:hypothetical protein
MASDEKRIGTMTTYEWYWHFLTHEVLTNELNELLTAAFSPSSFQVGTEQMREAAAKWHEVEIERCRAGIQRTPGSGELAAEIRGEYRLEISEHERCAERLRALPLPVAPEEGR